MLVPVYKMLRYNIIQKERVSISGGDLETYYDLLRRDSAVIHEYVDLIARAETVDLKSLTLLSIRTKNRSKVYLDLKGKYGISHNELQECLFSALRVVKRKFVGKEVGDYTRVVNHRRFKIDGQRLILLPLKINIELAKAPSGDIGAIRLHKDYVVLHIIRSIDKFEYTIGIDLGDTHAIAVLKDDELVYSSHFTDIGDVLKYIRGYDAVVKVGYPGKSYKVEIEILYYGLLDEGKVVHIVNESYTSMICSSCGAKGLRGGKIFYCPVCEKDLHADINAAINIARRSV